MRFADRAATFKDDQGNIDWHAYRLAWKREGFLHPSEIALLVELATGKDVCEVGSFKGLSAWAMAHTAAHVVCIDTFEADDAGQNQMGRFTTLAEFDRNVEEFGNIVTRLPMTSARAAELLPADKQFDFIFIDAMHTYEDVMADIKRWWPRVKPGGALAGHDYGHDAFPGVKQAFDEFFGPPSEPWVVTLRVVRKPE